jgi:hypothetical protein
VEKAIGQKGFYDEQERREKLHQKKAPAEVAQ